VSRTVYQPLIIRRSHPNLQFLGDADLHRFLSIAIDLIPDSKPSIPSATGDFVSAPKGRTSYQPWATPRD
jgi:hypothetical protein